ncbi:Autophagy-related protein 13 [Phytophthora nicotianae]|uniref:Autophagy-related protein 13 n=1 Tax=Phytophthora nicotianae TaxID=4792 RepID=A0A0W8CRL7_PHYNI|nr:Autophagy-related protein 13 [Phytophthora nicotianae]
MRVYFVMLAVLASALVIGYEAKEVTSIQMKKNEKHYLRSYGMDDVDMEDNTSDEERAGPLDPKVIPNLLAASSDEIVTTLKNFDNLDDLFAQLAKNEDNAKAIVAKLSENNKIIQNMDLISKLNDARTAIHYNQKLTDWVDTKTLDELSLAMKTSGMTPATRLFTEWHKSGKTPKEFSAAIAAIKNEDKRKRFAAFDFLFKSFVQKEQKNAKKAAVERWQKLMQLYRAARTAS